MSETSHIIDAVVNNWLARPLKDRGFNKRGRTWNRRVGPVGHVINVQGSSFNISHAMAGFTSGSFFLNLGVFHAGAHELWWEEPASFVTEVFCPIRTRLDELTNGEPLADFGDPTRPRRPSFDFTSADDVDPLGRVAADDLLSVGVPFLDRFDGPEAVRNFIMELKRRGWHLFPNEYLTAAIIDVELGDRAAAHAVFRDYEQAPFGAWAAKVERVTKLLGFPAIDST